MQRVEAGSDKESEKTIKLVSIIKDLFLPYNIPVHSTERIWDNTSKTDSNEYEWGSCSNVTKDIVANASHTPLSQEEQGTELRPLEFGPQNIYDTKENEQRHYEKIYMEDDTIKDLDKIINLFNIPPNLDDTSILTLTTTELDPPNDSLPLIFPDLID